MEHCFYMWQQQQDFYMPKVEGHTNTYNRRMDEAEGIGTNGEMGSLDERKNFDQFYFHLETIFGLLARNWKKRKIDFKI